jgi:hypothetical protein
MLKACSGDRVSKVVIEDFEMVYAGVRGERTGMRKCSAPKPILRARWIVDEESSVVIGVIIDTRCRGSSVGYRQTWDHTHSLPS